MKYLGIIIDRLWFKEYYDYMLKKMGEKTVFKIK